MNNKIKFKQKKISLPVRKRLRNRKDEVTY